MNDRTTDPFLVAFRGRFHSVLRWKQLDDFWDVLRRDAAGDWHIYVIGNSPPAEPVNADFFNNFVTEIDQLLRREHAEDYCGVVFTDSFDTPTFVKIFDPNHLGVSCGFSDNPPLPGWVLSKLPPVTLESAAVLPGNRRRWWNRLLGRP